MVLAWRVRLRVQIDVDFTKGSLNRDGMRRRLLEISDQQPGAGKARGELALLHLRIEPGGPEGILDLRRIRRRLVVGAIENQDRPLRNPFQPLDQRGLLFRGNHPPLQLGQLQPKLGCLFFQRLGCFDGCSGPRVERGGDLLVDGAGVACRQDFTANLNPNSLEVLRNAKLEPSLRGAAHGNRYQFERLGYFCVDRDSTAENLVFNRTVALRDTWAKIEKAQQASDKKS